MKKTILLSCILTLVPLAVFAATINVPCEQPTIQAGIDASINGDTLLLADGTYKDLGNYNIDFNGKSITVKSVSGPNGCILDCQTSGRAFILQNDETVILEGLTIKNGEATRGGAVFTDDNTNITIINCIFENNNASSSSGGAVYSSHTCSFTDCAFASNSSATQGGAICFSPPTLAHSINLTRCTFTSNSASGAGAVFTNADYTNFSSCLFTANTASAYGGAVAFYSSPSFTNCFFTLNDAPEGGAVAGYDSSAPSFINCVFISNSASSGGAIFSCSKYTSIFTNCTFTLNEATANGGAIACSSSFPEMMMKNCILWGDISPQGSEIDEKGATFTITFSDVESGYTGEGNIDLDPLFIYPTGGDVHLLYNSHCIDSGTSENAPVNDLDGNLRPMLSGYDMGAYEVQNISEGLTIDAFVAEPTTGGVPLTVDFTCIAHDTNDTITEYHWVFGDGNIATTVLNSTQHQYAIPGTFTATCTVVNSNNDNVLASTSINVSNEHPIANAGADQIIPRDIVDLDGSNSDDPDGTISFWQWDLSHTENPENDRAISGQIVSVSNLAFGHYIVTLTVTDNFGAKNTDTMYLSVAASDLKYTQDDYDQANQESYDSGHLTGYNQGYSEGYDTGYSTGYSEGYSNGVAACPLQEDENGVKHLVGPLLIEDSGLLIIQ